MAWSKDRSFANCPEKEIAGVCFEAPFLLLFRPVREGPLSLGFFEVRLPFRSGAQWFLHLSSGGFLGVVSIGAFASEDGAAAAEVGRGWRSAPFRQREFQPSFRNASAFGERKFRDTIFGYPNGKCAFHFWRVNTYSCRRILSNFSSSNSRK